MEFTDTVTPIARHPWAYSAFIVMVSIIFSYAIYLLIEQPVTRWLQMRTPKKAEPRPAPELLLSAGTSS